MGRFLTVKRRTFLKTTALASLQALAWPRTTWAEEGPAHATTLPGTACDGPPGSWTLAVLPDTQNYSEKFPEVFDRQCEWIAAHQKSHNILFVAHEGDITNHNNPPEWENARRSLSILNKAGVPYALVPGNHDTGPTEKLCSDRSTLLNDYFTEKDFQASSAFGLFEPGKLQNNWHQFDTPTGKFLIVGMEYGPRDVVVEWARNIVAKNADRKAIILTHSYLFCDSTRYDWAKYGAAQKWAAKGAKALVEDGGVNDGQDIWKKVIAPSSNVILTLNGHVLNNGTGHLVSPADDGHVVHQILANYQAAVQVDDGAGGIPFSPDPEAKRKTRAFGGGGFIRLMQFQPDGETIACRTYSPWYDRWLTQPDQQFSISLKKATA